MPVSSRLPHDSERRKAVRRPRQECREDQRRWRDRCVDKNVDDLWLESLNDLNAFDLISICEGHPGRRFHDYPGINLRLKAENVHHVIGAWNATADMLFSSLPITFGRIEVFVEVDLQRRIRLISGIPRKDDKLIVRISSRQRRIGSIMDSDTINWFVAAVESTKNLDKVIVSIIEQKLIENH